MKMLMLLPSEKRAQGLYRQRAPAIGKRNARRNRGDGRFYFTRKGFCDGRGNVPIASGVLCVLPPSLLLPGTGKA